MEPPQKSSKTLNYKGFPQDIGWLSDMLESLCSLPLHRSRRALRRPEILSTDVPKP
jgi:hypothetical protein